MRRRNIAVVGLVVGLLAAACGAGSATPAGDEGTDGQPVAGGSLAYGLLAETNSFNPAEGQWATSGYTVARAIFDPLMAYDDAGTPQPYLAKSVTPNEDFTEWTIKLRVGVKFHDGTFLDAEALRAHFEAMASGVVGSRAMSAVVGYEVAGPLELRIQLDQPWSTFPHGLTGQIGFVAAPSMLDDPDGGRQPVGTGPYVFDEWVPDASLSVVKNGSYWRDGYPYLDAVDFQILLDVNTRMLSLDAGDVDAIELREPVQVADVQAEAERGDKVVVTGEGETPELVVALNQGQLPFSDPVARAAVAAALDAGSVAAASGGDLIERATGPHKPDSPWYVELDRAEPDPNRALELVAEYEASYGEALSFSVKAPPVIELLLPLQLAQEQLKLAGIDMQIETVEQTRLIVDAIFGNYDATIFILFGGQNPARDWYFLHQDTLAPPGEFSLNVARWDNAAVSQVLDDMRATDDPDTQRLLWGVVQEALIEDRPFGFLAHLTPTVAARTAVQGLGEWSTPEGQPGLALVEGAPQLYQLWLR